MCHQVYTESIKHQHCLQTPQEEPEDIAWENDLHHLDDLVDVWINDPLLIIGISFYNLFYHLTTHCSMLHQH